MKMWIDDVRPAPDGYKRVTNVNEAKTHCCQLLDPNKVLHVEEFHLDHDAGDFASMGGDYIELLKWLEMKQHVNDWVITSVFKFHSMNPVGVDMMKRICRANGWRME